MAKAVSRDLDKFIVRLPAGMRDKIADAANKANRTMNAEVVSRLEFTFAVDVTVQDGGFDVGFGLDSPELKAALLKQRLGAAPEPDSLEARMATLEVRLKKLEALVSAK